MNKPPLMKSGRCLVVAALSALVPVTAALAEDRGTYRSYDEQSTSGAQGPMRSDIDSATPTYSGEDRRQFQDATPGSQGPVRSDTENLQGWSGSGEAATSQGSSTMHEQSDPYDTRARGAQGPMRSDVETQGYAGDTMSSDAAKGCPATSERFAPNAYYGEGSPLYSERGMASLQGRGRWC